MKFSSQRGTRDILPAEIKKWHFVEQKARELFERYDFSEIRTPIFEQSELFMRSIGQETDIVGKEMYTFVDKGDRSITLRPEETAPVVRAVLENNLLGQGELVKLYYVGPMFRYERPQAGRQRQFHQAGVEVFGSSDPLADVEVIELSLKYLHEVGLKDLEVGINSVGCSMCRPKFKQELQKHFRDNLKELCENCQKRYETNPLRILDCKDPKCQPYIHNAPASADFVCENCKTHFHKVIEHLKQFGIPHKLNKRLVRGLDYYTKTTFEVISKTLGAQNAVCGGGRYDDLVEELGGKSTPAVGFAVGLDRLLLVLEEHKVKLPEGERLAVYIATLGEESKIKGYEVLRNLRASGIISDMDYQGRSLNSQLKVADKLNAKFVIIIGEDELKNGMAVIKSMDNKTQEQVKFDEILNKLRARD